MMEKNEISSKMKGLSKALMRILVVGGLDGVQGFIENENGMCYEEDFKEVFVYKDTFGPEHFWTLTLFSTTCMVLAITAVILGLAWVAVQMKRYLDGRFLREIDALMTMDVGVRCALVTRMNSLEEERDKANDRIVGLERDLDRVLNYSNVLWESIVENSGSLLRERHDDISEARWLELEAMESANMQQWRMRTANRIGTPRAREATEDEMEEHFEEDSAVYGEPQTEEEPEPTNIRTEEEMSEPEREREDPLAGLTEEDMENMDLQDWSRRMQIVADHHENSLREAEIQGD